MNILQKIYDGIKNWKTPSWLRILLQQLQDLMIAILQQVTKAYIDYLLSEIIYAAGQDWSSEEKFAYVFKQAKKGFTEFAIVLKDSELRAIIEFLVNSLKKTKAIE